MERSDWSEVFFQRLKGNSNANFVAKLETIRDRFFFGVDLDRETIHLVFLNP